MQDMVEIVRSFSQKIKNGRTPQTTFSHLRSEVIELEIELALHNIGGTIENDGIIGEAMDIINCALDIVFQVCPDITTEQLNALQTAKCEKWARKYGDEHG